MFKSFRVSNKLKISIFTVEKLHCYSPQVTDIPVLLLKCFWFSLIAQLSLETSVGWDKISQLKLIQFLIIEYIIKLEIPVVSELENICQLVYCRGNSVQHLTEFNIISLNLSPSSEILSEIPVR
jgi:hypothetical protein